MKKSLFTLIAVLSLLVLTTRTVYAAGYLELREVRNDSAGGVIFVFDVVGDFSKSDFKGSFLTLGESRFPVDCNLQDAVLQCTTTRVTAGQYVNLNIGGFLFYVRVPERGGTPPAGSSEYCYPVYDLDEVDEWEQFDTHCQDTPANYGDTLIYFSEVFFELMNGSPFCTSPQPGDGFFRQVFCGG